MPLVAYRISSLKYRPFDGTGAALRGGRWNSPGREVVYCSSSYACALLEILVRANLRRLPGRHVCVVVTVPDALPTETVGAADLPGWNAPDRRASQAFGDRWLAEGRTAVLIVPSVVARPYERNVLVNPSHPDAGDLHLGKPTSVIWDPRLFTR